MERKTVTIFGSSFPQSGDEEYESAYRLGNYLGKNNLNVCTGGYGGIMDAVSKGAREAGTEAAGILLESSFADPSKHLSEKVRTKNLFDRIKILVERGDAYVILPGGTGTLVELSVIWEFFNKRIMKKKPAAAIGKMWEEIIPVIEERMLNEKRKTGLIKIFDNYENCAEYIIMKLKND